MKECFLGIDIGTSSSKGVIVDIDGDILAKASISHGMDSPFPGWFEQDADSVWWHDVIYLSKQLITQLSECSIPKEYLRSMAVSTIAPCVLPVNIYGKPLRPGIMYGIDTRATEEVKEIETLLGKEKIFQMTGQYLSSQSCCPKVRWIQKNEPWIWDKTYKILTATGYIVYRLTGNYTVDMYDAIGYAPVFNIRKQKWDNSWATEILDISMLPEIRWSIEPAGIISQKTSDETGLPAGITVITGTADAAAESLAAGLRSVGDMMLMYGSSNFFITKTQKLTPTPSFWASHYLVPGSTVLTGGMATVGSLFTWFNQTFPGRTFSEWEVLAAASTPGANGVTILPYFAGERTPIFNPAAKGIIFGLTLNTKPGDIYKAVQESIGFGIRHNIEVLQASGGDVQRIIAIGGGASSNQMMQCVTDIIGYPQQLPKQRMGACYGNAFLAAVGSGHKESLEEIDKWVKIGNEFLPDISKASAYNKAYGKFRELYESTKHLL
jgi:xylulokinase